ncbi:hypothetical protein KKG22_05045 [Patescibacteria group bacterium]|nr:hypothetical protein [Patescibacteria group bacterium]
MNGKFTKNELLIIIICITYSMLAYQPTFAQSQQIVTQKILGGGIDLFYNNYPNQMVDITFEGKITQTGDQGTVANYAGLTTWPEEAFIGVIDLNGTTAPWNLAVQGPAALTDGMKAIDLNGNKLKTITSTHKWATLTLLDSDSNQYIMTKNTNITEQNNIWYWEAPAYTWINGDVTAPTNTPAVTDLSNPTNYNIGIISFPVTILVKGPAQTTGIFGTGISFALIIPGNTPEGTYAGTITYTLQT